MPCAAEQAEQETKQAASKAEEAKRETEEAKRETEKRSVELREAGAKIDELVSALKNCQGERDAASAEARKVQSNKSVFVFFLMHARLLGALIHALLLGAAMPHGSYMVIMRWQASEEADRLKIGLSEANAEIERLLALLKKTQAALDEANKKCADLAEALAKLEAATLQKRLEDEASAAAAANGANKSGADLAQARARIEELEAALRKSQREVGELEKTRTTLQLKIEELLSALQKAQQDAALMKAAADAATVEANGVR